MLRLALFVAVFVVALSSACDHDEAPRCTRDQDCPAAFLCEPASGACVRMTTPLDIVAGPDAAPTDAATD